MLITETDHLVERVNFRIEQYRRHIQSMEREGRESDGAALVLQRLERAVVRLQLCRNMLKSGGNARKSIRSEPEKARCELLEGSSVS
jgi:hypothetical protein